MGNSTRKKERQRLKRKKKHIEIRRAQSVSPYRRIGASGQIRECLINEDWREAGQAVIYVLCAAPGGGNAMATFMVDLWCAGLKDAYGRLDITREEYNDALDHMSVLLDFVETDVETVRGVLAGAIRFARRNGFRLPPRYERWTAMVGGVGDCESADLSDFGVEGGKLRWVAPMEDLKRRLIGCSAEEFLAREDVEFIVEEGGCTLLDDETLEMEQGVENTHQRAADAVRKWCFANGEAPHPRLFEAIGMMFESMLQIGADEEDDEIDDETHASIGSENVSRFLSMETPENAREIAAAINQFQRFVGTFPSPEDFLSELGLDETEESD